VRVIGGKLKGKQLRTCRGLFLRPTSGKLRETIFNILGPFLSGGAVLDLFAGTGSLGIEALSRGMDRAVFVEKTPRAINILQKNIVGCDLEGQTEIMGCPVSKGLSILRFRKDQFKTIFLDPPYQGNMVGKTLHEVSGADILEKNGLVVVEHSFREAIEAAYGALKLDDRRHYGQTVISFFTH
jgi:16S rRNA (guanine966-N2)-methyltransferase